MTALASLAELPAADALAQWLAARTPANDDATADPADAFPPLALAATPAVVDEEPPTRTLEPEADPAAPAARAVEAAALDGHDDVVGEGSRCRTLWLAVLAQAVDDERREPTGYVGSPSFREVCGLAGIEPEWAIRKLANLPATPQPVAPPKPPRRPRKPRPVNRDFSIMLAHLRRKAGLNQTEAAALVGASPRRVSAWEAGQGCPPVARQAAILDLLRARAGAA